MDVPGPTQFMPFGIGSTKISVFTVDGDDGAFLEDVIGKAKTTKMRMNLSVENKDGLIAQNVFGTIKGETD